MKSLDLIIERWGQRLGESIAANRWLYVILPVILCLGITFGLPGISISNDYQNFFSEENSDLSAFKEFQSDYTNNDNILFVVIPNSGDVFQPQELAAVEALTELSWTIPYTTRVDSMTNFQHSAAAGDDIVVDRLVRNAETLTDDEILAIKDVALNEPLLRNNLVADDGRAAGVNINLQYPNESIQEVPDTVTAARNIRDRIEAQYPGVSIAISGIAMLNNAFAEASQNDMAVLVPLMYVLIVAVIILVLRSWTAGITTLLLVTLATLSAMGYAGYAGIAMTPISFIAPTVILTLAIADSVHLLLTAVAAMREGKSQRDSFIYSLRINILPISLTSLTTIIGFLSLNLSDSPPFWHLGNITAVGIATAWLLSITFLPALMLLLPLKIKSVEADRFSRWMDTLAGWVIRRHIPILVVFLITTTGLALQLTKLELNDDFVRYFDKDIEFRTDSETAIQYLNGIYLVEYSVGAGEVDGINRPEYLRHLEAYTHWLRQQPEVRHVFSYSDIIKRLNRNMYGDDPAYYKIPDSKLAAAQLLFLYETSLPSGTNLSDRVTTDKSATRITISIDDMTAKEGIAFFKRSEQWLRDNTPSYMWATPTSVSVMFSYISQRNIENMISGNFLALILISLLLIAGLRHIGYGVLSVLPNTLPIIATYGVWTLLVGQVGMAAAAVSATSLGIIVDDTVHFMTKYLRAIRVEGMSRPDAVRYAFSTVGKAICLTTVVLGIGFSTLVFSDFLINSQLGLLTLLSILLAMVFDLLLLPAILLIGYKPAEEENYESAYSS